MHGVINLRIPRANKAVLRKLKKIPTTIISDCLNRMNTMHAEIKAVLTNAKIVGQAITVQSMVGCNLASHKAIYVAKPGDIIVFDARGYVHTSVWGGVQTIAAKKRGIGGVVVDGSIRDVNEIKKLRFPVFCKGVTPAGPHKGWSDNINVPISCGGCPVIPGDVIVGDEDGVVVIPLTNVSEILRLCEKTIKKEREWVSKIKKGIPTTRILGLDNKIKSYKIRINK